MSFCPTRAASMSAGLTVRWRRDRNCSVCRHDRTSHSVCSASVIRACIALLSLHAPRRDHVQAHHGKLIRLLKHESSA